MFIENLIFPFKIIIYLFFLLFVQLFCLLLVIVTASQSIHVVKVSVNNNEIVFSLDEMEWDSFLIFDYLVLPNN